MTDRIVACEPEEVPRFARNAINLASAGLGACGLSATDEFFAPLERMLADGPAIFYPDLYDDNGKWMDGWETRRRRGGGHDHATIALAAPCRIDGFNVDTSHFTGNNAPACRIEGWRGTGAPDEATEWSEILPVHELDPDSHNFLACADDNLWTHLRIHIYPDGGIARLRVYGTPEIDAPPGTELDLVAALNGGRIVAFSDAHYGSFARMLAPGRGLNMGDGWETKRRRGPGHDWIVVALGGRGTIERVVVDTAHFKGNYPDSCSIQVADMPGFAEETREAVEAASANWDMLMEQQKLSADAVHEFDPDVVADRGPVTHIRLNIFPDGGVSRLRLFGRLA